MMVYSPAAVAAAFSSSSRPVLPGDRLCAAIPDPITTAASKALPMNSASRRRHSGFIATIRVRPGQAQQTPDCSFSAVPQHRDGRSALPGSALPGSALSGSPCTPAQLWSPPWPQKVGLSARTV